MTPEDQMNHARESIDVALDSLEASGVPAGAVLVALREAEARLMPRVRAELAQHVAHAAALTAALGEASAPKPPRAPRKPRTQASESTPETRVGFVLSALELASPQTLQEVAKVAGVSRGQAQIAIDALLTDGRVTRERAGKGWRYSHAKAAE